MLNIKLFVPPWRNQDRPTNNRWLAPNEAECGRYHFLSGSSSGLQVPFCIIACMISMALVRLVQPHLTNKPVCSSVLIVTFSDPRWQSGVFLRWSGAFQQQWTDAEVVSQMLPVLFCKTSGYIQKVEELVVSAIVCSTGATRFVTERTHG